MAGKNTTNANLIYQYTALVDKEMKRQMSAGFDYSREELVQFGFVPTFEQFEQAQTAPRQTSAEKMQRYVERLKTPLRERLKDQAIGELMLILRHHGAELAEMERELDAEVYEEGIF